MDPWVDFGNISESFVNFGKFKFRKFWPTPKIKRNKWKIFQKIFNEIFLEFFSPSLLMLSPFSPFWWFNKYGYVQSDHKLFQIFYFSITRRSEKKTPNKFAIKMKRDFHFQFSPGISPRMFGEGKKLVWCFDGCSVNI